MTKSESDHSTGNTLFKQICTVRGIFSGGTNDKSCQNRSTASIYECWEWDHASSAQRHHSVSVKLWHFSGATGTRSPLDVSTLRSAVRPETQRVSVLQIDGAVRARQRVERIDLQGWESCRGWRTLAALPNAWVSTDQEIGGSTLNYRVDSPEFWLFRILGYSLSDDSTEVLT